MKKVLVLVAAMLLVAANAMALTSIVGSPHDMLNNANYAGSSDEVCVFCHTPHGANVLNPNAPLWNRTAGAAINGWYNSATLNTLSKGATVQANITASDAPLCLSCHDGVSIGGALENPPNGATTTFNTPFVWASADAQLGTNLNNDHPIGMNYAAVQASASDISGLHATPGLQFYNGIMWCSTCHDVHDNTFSPFLAATNSGSDLCLTCHNK